MPEADRFCLAASALLAACGIATGAFAAHGLKDMLSPLQMGWWHTGVDYQMWHAVALIGLAPVPGARRPALLILAGTLIFSGSLYLMALTGLRALGAVTPLGGSLMIGGWLLLAWRTMRRGGAA